MRVFLAKRNQLLEMSRPNFLARVPVQARKLHMSGLATSGPPPLTTPKAPSATLSRAAEASCQSSTPLPADPNEAVKPVRRFNTSRALKTVNDSSTMDFAYFPDLAADEARRRLSVPLLGSRSAEAGTSQGAVEIGADNPVMKPEISPTTLHASYSAMADVHDNSAMTIDFHALAERAGVVSHPPTSPSFPSSSDPSDPASASASSSRDTTLGRLWSGIVGDVVGVKDKAKAVV